MMDPKKQIYLLLICQGFYLGSVCQQWTFPPKITALIGSCLEIPCTYHLAWSSGASDTVWYLNDKWRYQEILNTKDSSSVIKMYKGRTSLVPGDKSCTLRIDPVIEDDEDKYYPGITEERKINALKLHSKTVTVDLTDRADIQLYKLMLMTEGEATIIQCTIVHTCRSSPPSLQWNKPGQVHNQSVEISGGSWREESNLTYIPSYMDDGSTIQCTATYLNRLRTETSGTLTINYAPKNVTVILNDELMEGSDVTLQCSSFSKSEVYEYEWYKGKDKTKLPDRGWEITVRNVTWDEEPYSCAAINDVGRGESALTEIPVLYAATKVHIIKKNKGEFTELICVFQSSRPDVTHYTWMNDGSILPNEMRKTLTLYNNEASSGQYSCIAHNIAGNSSSAAIHNKGETSNMPLPLILGSVAAVFFLLVLILIIVFYLRTKKKADPPTSPIHGTTTRISLKAEDDNDYGNIQSNHNAHSSSMRSQPPVNMNVEENHAIYSNSDVMQPTNEVEYSVISHGQHNQTRQTSSRARQEETVEYATLIH
ncbi:B-cell receptor CD22-like [Ranitomeya imitator]|uniref:B-cell receptor CD22-like n=1 Tax=Ranitomeya imitator TaxID=111125 RepID=UPI0037E76F84